MSKKHKIPPEVKVDILRRVKEEGISVAAAAKDHGISENTIYSWLGTATKGAPSWADYRKLQKEKLGLVQMVGELTMYLSGPQKKNLYGIVSK
jgi:transposase-like protein